MTAREQLAEQVAAIRAGRGPAPSFYGTIPYSEITLECRGLMLPMLAMLWAVCHVNAAEIGGAGAGCLACSSISTSQDGELAGCLIVVRLAYRERPWNSIVPGFFATTDFDALMDALGDGAGPQPEREETWHD